ncbi:hypothetical protein NG791_01555 [Laspinema sp. D1]|uniref:hypothetical protein n=1 Tax=Laspinema palackyanum TaxID=3231601 RepID=UPI0034718A0A|nr:hypothetical protein [Laspinema sp. D2b]
MIQLIVGWVQNLVNFSIATEFKPVETLTPSQKGYKFEHDELKRLMLRLKRFETVEFTDVVGAPMTPQTVENRYGQDGGIDCVIRIIAPTERGAKIVATKIRNILINGDY